MCIHGYILYPHNTKLYIDAAKKYHKYLARLEKDESPDVKKTRLKLLRVKQRRIRVSICQATSLFLMYYSVRTILALREEMYAGTRQGG